MPAMHKGAISFGLVHIPIELHVAAQETGISFNQVVRDEDGHVSRVRYKKVCGRSGREVRQDEIIRGYQYDKDQYVLVDDAELEALKSEKDRNITIVGFSNLSEIPTVNLNKAYHCIPQKGGEKPFELLRKAMLKKKQVALGRTVLGQTDRLVVVMPTPDGLLVQSLYFEADIRAIQKPYQRPKVDPAQLAMAEQLLETMRKPFDISEYRDEYVHKVEDLIQKKIGKRSVVTTNTQGSVIDLMEALKSSLAANKPKAVKVPKPERKIGKAS